MGYFFAELLTTFEDELNVVEISNKLNIHPVQLGCISFVLELPCSIVRLIFNKSAFPFYLIEKDILMRCGGVPGSNVHKLMSS